MCDEDLAGSLKSIQEYMEHIRLSAADEYRQINRAKLIKKELLRRG